MGAVEALNKLYEKPYFILDLNELPRLFDFKRLTGTPIMFCDLYEAEIFAYWNDRVITIAHVAQNVIRL